MSPEGTRVAYSVDDREVWVASLDGSQSPSLVSVSDEADFCLDPAWSPDGARLAWHEWDFPHMPWDESRIALRDVPPSGGSVALLRVWVEDGVAVASPRFSPDGSRLGFLCDAGGWLNLWTARPDGGGPEPLLDEPWEHGGPTWGGGMRSWTWSPDANQIALCRNENGFGRLCFLDRATGQVGSAAKGVHYSLSWAGGRLAALRSGPRVPDQVVVASPGLPVAWDTVARGPVAGFGGSHAAEPEPVTWDGQDVPGVGRTVHGRLWKTEQSNSAAVPVLAWVHGGPTDQHRVAFNARLAFFLSRGWNVLQVDPRGSTGWGRAYAQALRGRFGELDVDDLARGIATAKSEGWGDPARIAVMGASSGGLVVLNLLATHPGLCAAGVDLYGVTDLADLAATTHRFEAHYMDGLVGPLPQAADLYRARSPISCAGAIRDPLLVLHGSADQVVPASQSAALVDALLRGGAPVEHHVYPDEGHGWSQPNTRADELARIEDFLNRHVLRGGC